MGERESLGFFGWLHFHDCEVVFEFDEVDHAAAYEVGGAYPGVGFWVDDVGCADAGEDFPVGWGDGFGPDVFHAEVYEVHGGEYGRFDGGSDADYSGAEVAGAELAEGFDVGGISCDGVGHAVGEVLDEFRAAFYCEDFAAHAHELFGYGDAEPAEPDHEYGGVLGCLLVSQ